TFAGWRVVSITDALFAAAATATAVEPRYTVFSVGPMPPYASHTNAIAVNSRGQVVGSGWELGFPRFGAYIWTRGASDGIPENPQMKDLGNLAGGDYFFSAQAWGINTRAQVVGEADVDWWGWKVSHAFLWENGVMRDLGTLPGG